MRRALGPILLLLAASLLAACAGDRPTGTLAFAAGGSIYLVELPDGEPRVVIEGDRGHASRWASAPALSPDGASIAFAREGDLWLADIDGSNQRRIVDRDTSPVSRGASHFKVGVQSAAWSSDGARIAYVAARVGGSGLAELWVTDTAGHAPQKVASDQIGLHFEAAWNDEGEPAFAAVATGRTAAALMQ